LQETHDYQIEIELKSDYLHHVILDQFTSKIEELMEKKALGEGYKSTAISKFERSFELSK
jgi:hypothetical protein